MKRTKILSITLLIFFTIVPRFALAGPASTNYQLKEYGFGSGGSDQLNSTDYKLFGISGETEAYQQSSTNYKVNGGLTFTILANAPPAPSLSTGSGSYYNKLGITLDTGNNPSTTEIAIAVSPDNFTSTTQYVQANDTLGASAVWQTNTLWGSSGFTIVGLTPGTTYSVKVAARMGNFTQSPYGPVAQATLANPTFAFSLRTTSQAAPPYSVDIGTLSSSSVTTAADTIDVGMTTNATGGGVVYLYGANTGLLSSRNSYTISSSSNDLTAATEGYGARTKSIGQASGGPMEKVAPYDGTGNNVGIIDTNKRPIVDSSSQPVTTGTASFELKAKASATAPAGTDYTDTLTIVASGTF